MTLFRRSVSLADNESFVHRVQKKYQVNPNSIDNQLAKDKEEMSEDNSFVKWGNPPGIYWMRRDAEERAKEGLREEEEDGEE